MAGPTYTYTADTPQAANPMNSTAPVIRENFQAIAEFVAVNHVGFNSSDAGKHNFISLPNTTAQEATPGEIIMYTAVTGSPNPCELFIQYPDGSSDTGVEISVAIPTPATGTSGGTASQGWCTFPSGIIFRWGTFACAANSNPQIFINMATGPQYTTNSMPTAVAPTSYGVQAPVGVLVYPGLPTNGRLPVALYSYVSVSTVVNFNYLCMGT